MSVIILTGKSCSGKDSVRGELEKLGFENIVSYTSRSMRIGEREGREYKYINKEEFLNLIDNNEMIEYRTYNTKFNNKPDTWYYGLRKQELDKDKDYIVILDLKGVENFIKYYGKENCFIVYMCCIADERKRRAIARGSFDNTEWERRAVADEIDFKESEVNRLTQFTMVNMSDDVNDIPKIAQILKRVYEQRMKGTKYDKHNRKRRNSK